MPVKRPGLSGTGLETARFQPWHGTLMFFQRPVDRQSPMYTSPAVNRLRSLGRKLGFNRLLSRYLLRFRGREEAFENLFLACAEAGDVIWDVGANVGHFSCRIAGHVGSSGRVIAFEPSPTCFERLVERTASMPWVLARELALGAEDRMGSLVVDSRQTGGTGHLGPDGDGSLPQVVVRSGQSLVEEDAALRPRGIKIDVEGAEYEVLQGLGSLLDEATLRFIGMEIHFARLDAMGRQDDPALIERLLVGRGFSVRWTDSSHLVATRVSG